MRDVSAKNWSLRTAAARATLTCSASTIDLIREDKAPKGDPRPIARVAAVMAAKNTPQIIPYCHSVPIDWVSVDFTLLESSIEVEVQVKGVYKTGVEMEAMTAAAAAALNLFDLLKPVDKKMGIERIELLDKKGGKSDAIAALAQDWTAAIIVCSDRATTGEYQDVSGGVLKAGLESFGAESVSLEIVPDDKAAIRKTVLKCADSGVEVILVCGGTGITQRDVTPEAVEQILVTRLPGIEEHLRRYSQDRIPTAMLSRAVAGIVGKSIVVTLPGSPGAARDALDALFPYVLHGVELLRT